MKLERFEFWVRPGESVPGQVEGDRIAKQVRKALTAFDGKATYRARQDGLLVVLLTVEDGSDAEDRARVALEDALNLASFPRPWRFGPTTPRPL